MSLHQKTDQEHLISCVVCEQTLSPRQKEPSYFPVSSSGFQAGDEDVRNCEDVSQLLRHLQTVNSAIWEMFTGAQNRRDLLALKPSANYLNDEVDSEEVRSLCFLFQDIELELKRRFQQTFDRADERWKDVHGKGA